MLMYLVEMFGGSLFLTECIEIAAAVCMGVRKRSALLLVLLVNCLTNPAAVYLTWIERIYLGAEAGYLKPVIYIMIEILVVIIEGCIYRQYMKENRHPFLFSLCVNAISFATGCLV